MKKFYMTIVALLCGAAAMAQSENIIYVPDITANAGDEVTVSVCLKNTDPVRNTQVRFAEFPEGMEIVVDDEEGDIIFERNADRLDLAAARKAEKNEKASLKKCFPIKVLSNGTILFGSNTSGYTDEEGWHSVVFLGNDGMIYSFNVTIAETVKNGIYKVPFTFSLAGPVSDPSETPQNVATASEGEVVINVGGTGIHNINAIDNDAPIYNVAGQRVSKAQKGVFIQNGKKVAVK